MKAKNENLEDKAERRYEVLAEGRGMREDKKELMRWVEIAYKNNDLSKVLRVAERDGYKPNRILQVICRHDCGGIELIGKKPARIIAIKNENGIEYAIEMINEEVNKLDRRKSNEE
jgi:hypothetical protein